MSSGRLAVSVGINSVLTLAWARLVGLDIFTWRQLLLWWYPSPSEALTPPAFPEGRWQLFTSVCSVPRAGAVSWALCSTAFRILCVYSKPGIHELREPLPSTNGPPWGLTGLAKSEQAHENVCGVVKCGLVGKAALYDIWMKFIGVTPVDSTNSSSRISQMVY